VRVKPVTWKKMNTPNRPAIRRNIGGHTPFREVMGPEPPDRSPDLWILASPRLPIPGTAIWERGNLAIWQRGGRRNALPNCPVAQLPRCRPLETVACCRVAPHSQWRDRAGFPETGPASGPRATSFPYIRGSYVARDTASGRPRLLRSRGRSEFGSTSISTVQPYARSS
jgi:hypothetical protein